MDILLISLIVYRKVVYLSYYTRITSEKVTNNILVSGCPYYSKIRYQYVLNAFKINF